MLLVLVRVPVFEEFLFVEDELVRVVVVEELTRVVEELVRVAAEEFMRVVAVP